jgi:hypothetical protein
VAGNFSVPVAQPILADDRVNYVGEPIAAVIANVLAAQLKIFKLGQPLQGLPAPSPLGAGLFAGISRLSHTPRHLPRNRQ